MKLQCGKFLIVLSLVYKKYSKLRNKKRKSTRLLTDSIVCDMLGRGEEGPSFV